MEVSENVMLVFTTLAAGVPTVWTLLLNYLAQSGIKLQTLKRTLIGGSAVPESLIRAFHDEFDIEVLQGWGMTETSPLATVRVPSLSKTGR